jgi:hypothetical protein
LFSLTTNAQFQENVIESVNYNVNSLALADIDNDNDNDLIVSGGTDNQLRWFENSNGIGNFNIPHGIIEYPFSWGGLISVDDIDSDNDIDILITTSEQDCGEIRTFKNTDSLGDFESFSSSMSTCGLQSPIAMGDIDGDNDNDWVSSVSASQLNDAKVSWFKNNGNGIVTEQIIEDLYLRSFQLVDIDNDNDNDLVGFNLYYPSQQQLFWYENTDSSGNYSIKHTIQINTNLDYYSKVIAADLDNDSDIDIIIAYDNIISWYENDGQGNFSPENIINNDNFTKRNILSVDLDTDGNLDIISTGDNNSIIYYRNNGQGNFNTITIIENLYQINSPIFAIDISGDNKLDIIEVSS